MNFKEFLDKVKKNIERFDKFIERHEDDERPNVESHVAKLMDQQGKQIQLLIDLTKRLGEDKPKQETRDEMMEKLRKEEKERKEKEKQRKMLAKALGKESE